MTDKATDAGERAAEVVESVVEGAVADVTAQVESAEARAEAAEAVAEALTDSARRDAMFEELETLFEEGIEECRAKLETRITEVVLLNQALSERLTASETLLAKLEAPKVTVTIPDQSILDPLAAEPKPEAATVTVEPAGASPAPIPEKVAGRANPRRWI